MSVTHLKFKRVILLLLGALACSCNLSPRFQRGESLPLIVLPGEIHDVIDDIPGGIGFSYSGLCFFNGRLYASTNVGLLEVEGGRPSGLYKWTDRHDVVTGPWPDPAHGLLWARHEGLDKLIRYDGKSWAVVEHPRPKEGFMRGDILSGFRGTGTPEGFWLEGGRHAWRWNNTASWWEEAQAPSGGVEGTLAGIIPLPGRTLVVMRHVLLPFLIGKGEDFKSDTVHYYEGEWKEVANHTGRSFLAEQVVIIKDAAYLRTGDGELLLVTPGGVTRLESPDDCEAMAATTAGTLLASFRGSGIHEYVGGWQRKFPSPYPPNEAEHWAYLAESDGKIAFAVNSKPQLHGDDPGQTTLWVSSGGELKAVTIS